jgi:hypothetical protein
MSTWLTLESTASLMRTGNNDVFIQMTDADLIALNQTAAKNQLELDLFTECGIDYLDTNHAIQTIIDRHEYTLQTALSYLQLALYYQEIQDGEGSKSYVRWKYYLKCYEYSKKAFGKLLINETNTVVTSRISLG